MKNKKINFGTFLLILILLFGFYKNTLAFVMPYLDINFTIQTDRGDGSFEIKVDNYDPDTTEPFETKIKNATTTNKIATSSLSFYVSSGSKVITKLRPLQNFNFKDANCTSNNSGIIFNYKTDQIEITAEPYSKVNCIINYRNGREPVLIVPGVLSSVLSRNDDNKTELWPNIKKIILNLFGDDFLNELALNDIGQPNMDYPIVLPTDILRNIENKDFFLGLINQLKSDGYIENQDLFVFPYDWRLDIRQMVDNSYTPLVPSLKEKIDKIISETKSEKINIVAHSMGGLLTKYYLSKYTSEGKVDKFIDIATPHLGSPNAFKTLFTGDDLGIKFGFLGLNQNKIKEISRNMPSIYQLLPSQNYFDNDLPDYKYYVYDFNDYDNNQEEGRLNFDQTKDFLKNLNKNSLLLDQADNLHQTLDNFVIDSAIKSYNIVGCAKPTIGKFFIFNDENGKYKIDLDYVSGDGTVPERSAKSFKTDQVFTVNDVQHAMMPSNESIRVLISSILKNKVQDFDYEKYNYVSNNNDFCELGDGDIYIVNGPLKVPDDEYEKYQPDVFENNLAFFAEADSQVSLLNNGSEVSTTTIKIKKRRGGKVRNTFVYSNLPIFSASSTVVIKPGEDNPEVTISNPEDEIDVNPDIVIPGDSIEDFVPPETTLEISNLATSTFVRFITSELVLKTNYRLDDQTFATGTEVNITKIGTTTVSYYSVDLFNNIENVKTADVNLVIESSVPVITSNSSHHHSGRTKEKEGDNQEEDQGYSILPDAITVLATSSFDLEAENKNNNNIEYDNVEEKTYVVTTTIDSTKEEDDKKVIQNYASVSESKSDYSYLIILIIFLLTLLFIYKIRTKNKNE